MKITNFFKNALLSYMTVLVVLALLPAFIITNDISLVDALIEAINRPPSQ
ncbi:hypothetical protein [Thermaerobacillus caldiproteolyticus]|uniref:Uncharacterized protein n=1 Tax=Thermaerobacillus caldiproteolyticus TaxID=247480 RepID=A0A7W0BZL2_9BACL|nr:hypothetical protein [Anoxybacillus caldiproteolyticus]MBA2874224.1 hypothetical protein [Anoxybacillus caldiproteolyticus]QPA31842.1 hypothetical protein ISX45_02210 [Anoxybacillus caldiproteolyticus]